jgi:hypothetical protein
MRSIPYAHISQALFELVCQGEVLAARSQLEARFGRQLLEQTPSLDFRLKARTCMQLWINFLQR